MSSLKCSSCMHLAYLIVYMYLYVLNTDNYVLGTSNSSELWTKI